jgi:hypothetical protein
MSTGTPDPSDSTDPRPFDELSHTRQRLLKAVAVTEGLEPFTRPALEEDVEEADLSEVVDDTDDLMSSVRTPMLNNLERDGYLRKTFQGGTSPIVLDLGYDEERESDQHEVAPFGYTSRLHNLVTQIEERENVRRNILEEVRDPSDFLEVVETTNRIVGRTVLVVVSEPSKYRFNQEPLEMVLSKAD